MTERSPIKNRARQESDDASEPAAPADAKPTDPDPRDGADQCLIIGRTNSGKSCFLAGLDYAATMCDLPNFEWRTDEWEGKMQELAAGFMASCRDGKPKVDGTIKVDEGGFQYQISHKKKDTKTGKFWFIDGKGGTFFGKEDKVGGPRKSEGTSTDSAEEIDEEQLESDKALMLKRAKKCNSLLLCIDPTESEGDQAKVFFEKLVTILVALPKGSFSRVAIVLTKCDVQFVDKGTGALEAACNIDPWEKVTQVFSRYGLRKFEQRFGDADVVACWSSIFGFLPCGSSNCIPGKTVMALHDDDDPSWFDRWQPFQVFEPIVFLLTGIKTPGCKTRSGNR